MDEARLENYAKLGSHRSRLKSCERDFYAFRPYKFTLRKIELNFIWKVLNLDLLSDTNKPP